MARSPAERLQPGKPLTLGMSVGAAVFPHDGEVYEALLATADSRMYQNKASRKRHSPRRGARPGPEIELIPLVADLSPDEIQRAAVGVI